MGERRTARQEQPGDQSRSYAQLATRDSNDSLEGWIPATRRLNPVESRALAARGPMFRYAPPDQPTLSRHLRCYEEITGIQVRRSTGRPSRVPALVAACYRVHGEDLPRLIADRFAATGTTTNLLIAIRLTRPVDDASREKRVVEPEPGEAKPSPPLPAGSRIPGLLYGPANRPPFDPTSKRRWDDRPSNPDAWRSAVERFDTPAGDDPEHAVAAAPPWHCYADLGSGHVGGSRADGSTICQTCHPATSPRPGDAP
jgi:hypothetical protein